MLRGNYKVNQTSATTTFPRDISDDYIRRGCLIIFADEDEASAQGSAHAEPQHLPNSAAECHVGAETTAAFVSG